MHAHYLQHVPFEGLGIIEPWLQAEGYDIASTRFYEPAKLPDWSEVDFLIVMGGPMSVNDESEFHGRLTRSNLFGGASSRRNQF